MAKKRILTPASSLLITTEAADRLISRGDGGAALVYLYLLRSGSAFDEAAAAAALRLTPEAMQAAIGILSEEGLILSEGEDAAPAREAATPPVQEDVLPQYTVEDVKNKLAGDRQFAALLKDVQSSLGKLLSSEDTLKLYGIYDSLGLPPEVILYLVHHCIREYQRRSGPGRMPTLRYIERAAYQWEKEGITTYDLAEAHVKDRERIQGLSGPFAAALEIRDRPLSSTERAYVEAWIGLGFREDAAAIAYDRTVTRTGKLNWKYMDSIFKSWHGKGLHTPKEIEEGDVRQAAPGKQQPAAGANQQGRVTAKDIERMERYLRSKPGE